MRRSDGIVDLEPGQCEGDLLVLTVSLGDEGDSQDVGEHDDGIVVGREERAFTGLALRGTEVHLVEGGEATERLEVGGRLVLGGEGEDLVAGVEHLLVLGEDGVVLVRLWLGDREE
ncbi:MAG: hypothetical protein GEU90_09075 [Gemmatimonas sp.]|nr:hypothetical protein [Gemmatimonas sp.]